MNNINNENKLCLGCMREINDEKKCPFCGFDESEYTASPHHLPLRTVLNGKYIIGRVLGEGGFGITYLGYDINLDIKIAVKEYYPAGYVTRENTTTNTVSPYVGEKEQYFERGRIRFVEEAKSLAKFYALPGIVSIKDFFHENGTAYIVMEFVEGQTLKELLSHTGGKLPADKVFEMMKPLIRSLSEIHRAGIIHRDISPDNIMVTNEGNVKLLDFGVARNYQDSGDKSISVLLKPGYASEEQYRSRGIQGTWTDVYALSATMYHAITGITPAESIERARADEVKTPSTLGIPIQPQQEAALIKGMAVMQNDRYKNVDELSAALYPNAAEQIQTIVSTSVQSLMPNTQNQVQCRPEGNKPIFVYWTKLKNILGDKNNKKKRNIILACAGAFVILVVCFLVFCLPSMQYDWAQDQMMRGSYDNAITVFANLGDYKDAGEKALEAKFEKADSLYNEGKYSESIGVYDELISETKDVSQRNRAIYSKANSLLLNNNYKEAEAAFKELGDYKDSAEMITRCEYRYASSLATAGKYEEAYTVYDSLGKYEDAVSQSENCCLAQLKVVLEDESTDEGIRGVWIDRCLKNKDITDKAHREIGDVMKEKIAGGSQDYIYSLMMNDFKDYPDKYVEQGYILAKDYIVKSDYKKGNDVLDWILAQNYKDSAEILLECKYQLVQRLVVSNPTDTNTLTQLYYVAKANYKDSRKMMDSICTPQFLLTFVSHDTPTFSQKHKRAWYYYWTGKVAFREYKYSVSMKINIASPIPIQGKVQMKCTAYRSTGIPYSTRKGKKTYTFTCTIKPDITSAKLSGNTKWLRGKPSFKSLSSASGKYVLHVYYGS